MGQRFLRWFTTRRLAGAILFVALFAMAVRAPVDTDTWWHLQAGRVTVETGQILQIDRFSHTRYGSAWINHSWLSQVVLYGLFNRFAYAGLGVWIGAVVTATFGLVYVQMSGDVFTRAFILVLAAATSAVIWVARPQLLSFLLTAAVAYVIYLFKWRQVNRLWLLPPIFILWVNLHAGYALGFMLLVAFVVGEAFNHLLAWMGLPREAPVVRWRGIALVVGIALLSVLLLVINPYTTRMWTYYLDTVGIGALQDYIQEWQSPDFHPLHTQPFIWFLLLLLGAIGLSGQGIDGTDLSMVAMFVYASLLAGRNFAPFALVTAPVLSRHVSGIWKRLDLGRRVRRARHRPWMGAVNLVVLSVLLLLAGLKAAQPLSAEFNAAQQRESLPVEAVDWIRRHDPPRELFNPYNWGGYLIWSLYPEYRVFVDGRTDLYGDRLLRRYLTVEFGREGYREILDEHEVETVLTYAEGPLSIRLACSADWERVYEDGMAAIWVRR